MKIAIQNNPANLDSLYDTGVEPADKKAKRIHSLVDDNYDFSGNDATDVTSVENWHKFGTLGVDYARASKEMYLIFDAKAGATESDKWNNCTTEEKTCLAKRHLVSKSLRLEIFSDDDDFENFKNHATLSIESRKNRINVATIAIGYEIQSSVDRADLFTEVFDKIGRFVNSNDGDLRDWVRSVGPYVGGGFQAKSYYNNAIETIFETIVENGEY